MFAKWFLIFPAAFALPLSAAAQGGPPLLTDDPGTPGPGNGELNIAAQASPSAGAFPYQLPVLDANYGWGERTQLNLQLGYAGANLYGQGPFTGLGTYSAAVQFRCLDEENTGVAVSTYPRFDFRGPGSSKNANLTTPGTRAFLPIELSKEFGRLGVNPEIGFAHFSRQLDEWDFGLAFSFEIEKERELLFETHGRKIQGLGRLEILPQLGERWALAEHVSVISAFGRTLAQLDGEAAFWNLYVGAQLRF